MRTFIRLAALALTLTASAASAQQATPGQAKAVFAGGCFWCTEVDFDKVPGVTRTISGYIGGKTENPTYEQIGRGTSGHTEGVEVTFDPSKVSYDKLVEVFWRTIDPLDKGGQFCDRGSQYRPEIFAVDAGQKAIAEASKAALVASNRFKQPIVVEITAGQKFWPAEDYHQDFYKKSPVRYYSYRAGCGRDARIESLWGKEAGGKPLLTQ